MSSAFEQAKLLKEQSRVLTLEEQVRTQMLPFHGHGGIQVRDMSIFVDGRETVVVTIHGSIVHIKFGPTSISCGDMESFTMEFANIMQRYV